jgi:uncharacterized protein
MKQEFDPRHLSLGTFAKSGANLVGQERLAKFERLIEETMGLGAETPVTFEAEGSLRKDAGGSDEVWLHLSASATLMRTCQRCLSPVEVDASFSREFRFVANEELAEVEDEESDEDVLVFSHAFDLLALIEDELLMEMPTSPKHDVCPQPVKLSVADLDFVEESEVKPNPFAVLEQLKIR